MSKRAGGSSCLACSLLQASDDTAFTTSSLATHSRERYVLPQVLTTLRQVPKKVKERHTYINTRYVAGIRDGNTSPYNHAREGHEVYFEGHEGKEMSLSWDCLVKRSWCCGSRENVNHLQPQAALGGSMGFGCQLFHLAESLAKIIPTDNT